MNIWKSYCTPAFYNIYFDILVYKGMRREDAENLKGHYLAYLQRIKATRFAQDLKAIDKSEHFLEKLHEIFEIKWKDKLKYKEMPLHFYKYLKFLESMQAVHNNYFNEEEKKRIKGMADSLHAEELTEYETEYIVNGKLVALMNPGLLYILREYIGEGKVAPKKTALACSNYYGDLIDMTASDYAELINHLWWPTRKVKKGGKHNKIKITFPDGEEKELTTLCALTEIVNFYGFNAVLDKNLQIRKEKFLVKYVNVGKEKIYDSFGERMYINNQGDSKDRIHMARTINIMFGEKLQIELI